MSSDEPRLKVKRGGQMLGPLGILDVAEMLAEGRVAETDLVSENDGPWTTIAAYVAAQSGGVVEAPASPPPPRAAPSRPNSAAAPHHRGSDAVPAPPPATSKPAVATSSGPLRVAPSRIGLPKASASRIQGTADAAATETPAKPDSSVLGGGLPSDLRPIFNGRDFAGFEFSPIEDWMNGLAEVWSVQEGVIQFDGKAMRPHLLTIAEYSDFELWIGWRAKSRGWRGGLFLRCESNPAGARPWLSLSESDAGKLHGPDTSGSAAVPGFLKPPGEWNVWRIVAEGPKIGLWCNRQCAWSKGMLKRDRGKIGLRAEGTPLEFRFLQIREIPRK